MITVKQGDLIHIVPENGPERDMLVAHVEHHIITLRDPNDEVHRAEMAAVYEKYAPPEPWSPP